MNQIIEYITNQNILCIKSQHVVQVKYRQSAWNHGSVSDPSSPWCGWKPCCRCTPPAEAKSGWRTSSPPCPWCSLQPSGASLAVSAGTSAVLQRERKSNLSTVTPQHERQAGLTGINTHGISWSGWGICLQPFCCRSWWTDRADTPACRSDRESWTLPSAPPQSFLSSLEAQDTLAPYFHETLKKKYKLIVMLVTCNVIYYLLKGVRHSAVSRSLLCISVWIQSEKADTRV